MTEAERLAAIMHDGDLDFVLDEIYSKILNEYYPAFLEFQKNMEVKGSGEQGEFL